MLRAVWYNLSDLPSHQVYQLVHEKRRRKSHDSTRWESYELSTYRASEDIKYHCKTGTL